MPPAVSRSGDKVAFVRGVLQVSSCRVLEPLRQCREVFNEKDTRHASRPRAAREHLAKEFCGAPVAREVGLAVLAEFDVPDDALVYCESNSKGLFLRLQSGEREDRLLILDAKRPPPPSRNLVDLDNLEAVTPKQREKLRAFLQAHDGTDTGLLAASELAKFKFDPEAEQEPESNTHIYAGFVSRGDLTVWGGEKKHRKSTVMLQLAISMATGRDFLKLRFVAGKPLTVVIIDFESKGGSLKRRYDGIVNAMKLDAREQEQLRTNLTILEVRKILQAGQSFPKFAAPGKNKTPDASADANFWRELAAQSRADVLIIDPLRNLHDAEENDSTAIAALLTEMRRVFRDATVILTHHMRKSNEHAGHLFEDLRRFSDGLRGSSALNSARRRGCVAGTRSKRNHGRDHLPGCVYAGRSRHRAVSNHGKRPRVVLFRNDDPDASPSQSLLRGTEG